MENLRTGSVLGELHEEERALGAVDAERGPCRSLKSSFLRGLQGRSSLLRTSIHLQSTQLSLQPFHLCDISSREAMNAFLSVICERRTICVQKQRLPTAASEVASWCKNNLSSHLPLSTFALARGVVSTILHVGRLRWNGTYTSLRMSLSCV